MQKAAKSIPRQLRPVVTYGHSQGAYAALKYARTFEAEVVIASAPQYSINPAIIQHDRRFTRYYNKEINGEMEIGVTDQAGHVVLIYDPYAENDFEHVKFIQDLNYEPTTHFPVYHLGHDMMEVLSQGDLILQIIQRVIHGGELMSLRLKVNKMKKNSIRFSINFAEQTLRRDKPHAAIGILENVLLRNRGQIRDHDVLARDRTLEQARLRVASKSK